MIKFYCTSVFFRVGTTPRRYQVLEKKHLAGAKIGMKHANRKKSLLNGIHGKTFKLEVTQMKKHVMRYVGLALLFTFVLAVNGYAQEQEQQMMQQQPGAEVNVSEQELDQIATAYSKIHEIRIELQENLAEVEDPAQAQQMQQQAGDAMVGAVEDSGLDVETYNQVMEAVQTDEELREQLSAKLEQLQ
jgi:predicted exporter